MRRFFIVAAASLMATAAFAQSSTTVIHKEGVDGDKTVVKKEMGDGTVVKKKVETTGTTGCSTKSVSHSNDMGDKVTRTKSDC